MNRVKYWKKESKTLRKRYRSIFTGAAALFSSVVISYTAITAAICVFLAKTDIHRAAVIAFAGVFFALGAALIGLMSIGGRHLALSLYRRRRESAEHHITVGELFYAFGENSNRRHSGRILRSFLKKLFVFSLAVAGFVLLFSIFGARHIIIAAAVFAFIGFISCVQSSSLFWIFEHDKDYRSSGIAPKQLSSYAMTGRTRESISMGAKRFLRFILALIFLPFFAFIYFPYAWTTEAVRAECIASELVC